MARLKKTIHHFGKAMEDVYFFTCLFPLKVIFTDGKDDFTKTLLCKKNAFVDDIWNRFCFCPLSRECSTRLVQDHDREPLKPNVKMLESKYNVILILELPFLKFLDCLQILSLATAQRSAQTTSNNVKRI